LLIEKLHPLPYQLYLSHTYENDLLEYTLPEMLRVGVEDLTLQILVLDLGDPHLFLGSAVDPPSGLAMKNALSLLEELGAVECRWRKEESDPETCSDLDVAVEMTALGYHLAILPVEPRIGKIMIYGAILGCVDDSLTIAASMSSKNFFAASFDNREAADDARKALSMDDSDHLTVLAVFNEYQEIRAKKGNRLAQQFTQTNYLNRSALFQMEELRKQYSRLLVDIGFLPKKFALSRFRAVRTEDTTLIKAVLCAGLYPNIIVAPKSLLICGSKQTASEVAFQSRRRGEVHLHPCTLSSSTKTLSSRYLCYHEIVKTSKIYVRDCTAVTPFSLLLFGGALEVYHKEGVIAVDQWLKFRISSPKSAIYVKYLRSQMEQLLLRRIISPDELDDLSRTSNALIEAVRVLLRSENHSGLATTGVTLNDGADIVRPWIGPDREGLRPESGARGSQRGGRGRYRSDKSN
jgi:HrpA-like RNA helicase